MVEYLSGHSWPFTADDNTECMGADIKVMCRNWKEANVLEAYVGVLLTMKVVYSATTHIIDNFGSKILRVTYIYD